MEKPNEVNERARMKRRIQTLEKALADAHNNLAIERACVKVPCQKAGIEDVAGLKKDSSDEFFPNLIIHRGSETWNGPEKRRLLCKGFSL